MDEFHTQHDPLALAYELFEEFRDEPYEGGTLFIPRPIWLDAALEYGRTFSVLFERDVGMPVEHLWATCRGLARLGIKTASADASADEAKLANWGGYSATLPIAREKLLGGDLEEEARNELGKSFPGLQIDQSLGESVTRFVDLASSASRGAASRGGQ